MSAGDRWPEPFDGDDFAGQVCLVTGAAQGIGAAIAARMGQLGAAVALTDINLQGADKRAQELRIAGCRAEAFALDVRDTAAIESVVTEVEEALGPIDVLVNNAGLCRVGDSLQLTDEDWQQHVDVLLSGPFKLIRRIAGGMLNRGRGAILNISSIGGLGGWPQRAAYNSAKGGIKVLTEVLATEWSSRGIRVNAVAPAVTRTEILEKVIANSGGRINNDEFEGRTPLGRIAEVQEIAAAVTFLASPRAAAITGETLAVDGGWLASDGFPLDVEMQGAVGPPGGNVRVAVVAAADAPPEGVLEHLGLAVTRVGAEQLDAPPLEPLRKGERLVWIHQVPAAAGWDLDEASLLLRSVRAAERLAAASGGPLTMIALLPSRGLFPGPEGLAGDLARGAFEGLMQAEIRVWSQRGDRIMGLVYAGVDGLRLPGQRPDKETRLRTPSGKSASPVELADALRYLGSAEAAYVTGALLHVDGGWNAYSWVYPARTI